MQVDPVKENDFLKIAFPLAILACVVIGFWPIFPKLARQWSSGDNSYCYLIVPLFLYLCWEERGRFRFLEFSWNPWGILPAILSVCLIFLGELGSMITLLYIGLWGCAVGLIVTLYGKRARHLLFPILILVFIVPLPPFLNQTISFKLKLMASALSTEMLRATGISALLEGNIIDLGVGKLNVVDACSGLRYIMPIILMGLLVGYFFVRGIWRRLVILIIAMPLSVILNSFRIYITGIFTVNGHPELAEDTFHDFFGIAIFLTAFLTLGCMAFILKRIGSQPPAAFWKDSFRSFPGSKARFIMTACFCLLFAGGGLAMQKISSDSTCPPREQFASFPMAIGDWHGERQYISEKILDSLWSDDYLQAMYLKKGSPDVIHLLIPFYEYQGTHHTAHAPQSCLLGGGFSMRKSGKRLVAVAPDRQIEIMTLLLEKGDNKVLAGYFFLQRGRVITNPWHNKFYLMWDALTKHRTDGALVRAELVMAPGRDVDEAYEELMGFMIQLWPVLAEYVPG